jgi:hypothetical protein
MKLGMNCTSLEAIFTCVPSIAWKVGNTTPVPFSGGMCSVNSGENDFFSEKLNLTIIKMHEIFWFDEKL